VRRVETLRSTVFSARDGLGADRTGVAVNIGTAGVCIYTDSPEPVGSAIRVSLEPRPDDAKSQAISARGRVVYVTAPSEHGVTMGVRFDLASLRPSPPRGLVALAFRPATSEASADALPQEQDIAGRPTRSVRMQASTMAFLILLLLLLVSRSFFVAPMVGREGHAGDWMRASVEEDKDELPASRRSPAPGATASSGVAERTQAAERVQAVSYLATEADSVETLSVRIEVDPSAMAAGDDIAAAMVLDAVADMADRAPEEWPATVPAMLDMISGDGDHAAIADTVLADVVGLDPAVAHESAELGLVVRKSSHELIVVRNGCPRAIFVVGLGFGDATPTGRFRIANKIARPDWFNSGAVVKAGDPRNPLGASWMGLGMEQGPTSYGIHPTQDAASIGQDRSRGCIRLCPRDAETLFRLCPLGTPVWICE